MQTDGTPPIVPLTPTMKYQVGIPSMDNPHVEVVEKPQDNIFSGLPTLQALPTLTIIDNIQGGVERIKDKVEENAQEEKVEEEKKEDEQEEEEDKTKTPRVIDDVEQV